MFPAHCNEVGLRKVNFPLRNEEIHNAALGKRVYAKTRYLVLTDGEEWAVVRIESEGKGLFREVRKVDIIALPENVEFIEDKNVNVLSASAMSQAASRRNKATVIVKGAFDHYSFIQDKNAITLTVCDVVPPKPPKLLDLTEKVLGSESIDRPVIIVPRTLDLHGLVGPKDDLVMLPCRTSGVEMKQDVLFLDEAPTLSSQEAKQVTLVGCDLSREIFHSLYGVSTTFRNMCPKRFVSENCPEELSLCLCCRIGDEPKRENNCIALPWGVTSKQVETAIKSLWE